MKNIFLKITSLIFASLLIVLIGCEKDDLPKLDAEMATWKSDGITSTSVELSGIVVAEGNGFTEHGVCWSTSENPTTADSKQTVDKIEKAVYWLNVTGLDHLTSYHYRAYVITEAGETLYGEDKTFTTLANIATVTASAATNITDIMAQIAANVPYDGKDAVTSKGLCWNTATLPTIENDSTLNGEGIGEFTADLTGLLPATMYYARAYAVNKIGIAYSTEVSFTTNNGVAVLTTDSVTEITKTTANIYGNVLAAGGVDITERGFVYGMSADPTIADTKIVDAENTEGTMMAALTELASGKKFFVRAFATNSLGTAYGETIEFTTVSDITTWYLPGSYVAASYPGSTFADWDPANSPIIMNTVDNPTVLEGFVNMTNNSSEWKFASKPNWDGPNYGAGANAGELDASGANFVSDAGYYKINVDMSTTPMTYKAVSTDWGVIGDATPGLWDTDTNLTYDAASQTWRGTVHLTAASFKFRANDGWDINYGSTAADNTLNDGGENISNEVEDDYDITVDFSTPNAYTYMANRWGVIGDATPGLWDTDTNMSWDAGNGVFTVTLDLVASGSYKFRANDDWGYNLGGSVDDLTVGGDNLTVSEDGSYTLTLNTITKVATVTKN